LWLFIVQLKDSGIFKDEDKTAICKILAFRSRVGGKCKIEKQVLPVFLSYQILGSIHFWCLWQTKTIGKESFLPNFKS
jgi:hypothetical protein